MLTEFKVGRRHEGRQKGGKPQPVKLDRATADHSQDGFPVARPSTARSDKGWAILPQVGKPHKAVFVTAEPRIGAAARRLRRRVKLVFTLEFHSPYPQHNIGKFRLSTTTSPNPAGGSLARRRRAPPWRSPPEKRSAQQRKQIAAYYRTVSPLLGPAAAGDRRRWRRRRRSC